VTYLEQKVDNIWKKTLTGHNEEYFSVIKAKSQYIKQGTKGYSHCKSWFRKHAYNIQDHKNQGTQPTSL